MIFDNGSMHSNLNCLLHGITPEVQSKFLTKNEITKLNRLWHPWDREKVEYFTLGDLWNCYDEWSAYGAGVPMSLNNGETLVQYYVPYLSAIQIFTSNSSSISSLRDIAAESGEVETRDWFSDSCSDESDLWRWDGSSSSEEGCRFEKETILSQQQLLPNERLGSLYFQYFERSTPYGRAPLFDKIHGFSGRYPSLMSLRSVDLSPASWMAVAWYPIYHIPMGRTIKDLSTCFLTYHTLSSSFQDELEGDEKRRKEGGEGILGLAPFGLATYKLQGSVWGSGNEGRDQEKLVSLLSVADSWLKQLRVHHHDFNYFTATRRG